MKRVSAVLLLLALAIAIPITLEKAKAAPAGSDATQAVTNLENQWVKESKAGNAAGVGALLADDVVIVDSDGSTYGKSGVMDHVKKAKWQTNEISGVKVTAHGNTAIATGVWTGKGTGPDGKAVNTREHWVDTWAKMPNGKWLCVASGSATMK